MTDQGAVSAHNRRAAAIFGIDYPRWLENISSPDRGLERPCVPYGVDAVRAVECENSFGGTASRFGTDAGTYQNCFAILVEAKSTAGVFALMNAPAFDQRTHFTFQCGHDGEPTHIRYPETTPLLGAMRHRREQSSIPAHAQPLQKWRTSSSFPYARRPRWRGVPYSAFCR